MSSIHSLNAGIYIVFFHNYLYNTTRNSVACYDFIFFRNFLLTFFFFYHIIIKSQVMSYDFNVAA